jgi:hypothetical protein
MDEWSLIGAHGLGDAFELLEVRPFIMNSDTTLEAASQPMWAG